MTLPDRMLGQTGLRVSCLGLGTVKFGRTQAVKYPTRFTLPTDEQLSHLLGLARELGINLLDTAPAYGSSEQRLGQLLSDRHRWILCSKAGETFQQGKSSFDYSAAHIQHSIERSLQRLRTDYLDIALIHSNGEDAKIINETDCLATLQTLKQKGLIRAVGMSTKTVAGGLQAAQLSDVVMVSYNPTATAELKVIHEAATLNKGILIKKALNSGHVGAASAGAEPDPADHNNTNSRANNSKKPGRHSAADSLRFALAPSGVSSVIIGTINPAHLQANVAAIVR